MEDLTDIYDLYMLSFENVGLMKEGKVPFSVRQHRTGLASLTLSFDDTVQIVLLFAYISLFARLIIGVQRGRSSTLRSKRTCIVLSLLLELTFASVRGYAWYNYEVAVSVLILKNFVSLCREGGQLYDLRGEEEAPTQEVRVIHCTDQGRMTLQMRDYNDFRSAWPPAY